MDVSDSAYSVQNNCTFLSGVATRSSQVRHQGRTHAGTGTRLTNGLFRTNVQPGLSSESESEYYPRTGSARSRGVSRVQDIATRSGG
jgi:hypothetical protein